MNGPLKVALWVLALFWIVVPVIDVFVLDLESTSSLQVWAMYFLVLIAGSIALSIARFRGVNIPVPVKFSALLFHILIIFILYGNIVSSLGLGEHYAGESLFVISSVILLEEVIAGIVSAALVALPTVLSAGRWTIGVAFVYWLPVMFFSGGSIFERSMPWLAVAQLLVVLLAFILVFWFFRLFVVKRF